jgi:FixJ family two-component response regulator
MPGHPRVFVVDTDSPTRNSLARLFSSAGIEAEAFDSARAFLRRPLPRAPSCLILDVGLPELDALAIRGRLAQSQAFIPVVLFSRDVEDAYVLEAVTRALAQADAAWSEQREYAARLARLTARERQVAELVVQGRLTKQIASELGISEETVKVHRVRVNRKLEVDSVAALVRLFDRQIF